MFGRRQIVMGAAAPVGSAMISPLAAAPFEWLRTSPSDAGFVSDLEARLDKLIADKRVWGLHGVLVIRGRRIVLERYFEGEDNNWGQQLGVVRFGPAAGRAALRTVSRISGPGRGGRAPHAADHRARAVDVAWRAMERNRPRL